MLKGFLKTTYKLNVLPVRMTHARDPKQMFLKTQEEKDEEAKEAETAKDRHRQA